MKIESYIGSAMKQYHRLSPNCCKNV